MERKLEKMGGCGGPLQTESYLVNHHRRNGHGNTESRKTRHSPKKCRCQEIVCGQPRQHEVEGLSGLRTRRQGLEGVGG